ncbi:MAG TPA: flagellar motor stator protein MotA [Bryobacteraceae bacterium]|nr:flagellar motor stator protein MotA [Bryobacteraceae bacterium]
MLALLGIVLVFAAVLGGFLLERGNPYVLMQPAEVLIIGGAAAGILLLANPWFVIRKMAQGALLAFRPPGRDRQTFLDRLRLLYEVFVFAQRSGGFMQLENDIDRPSESAVFGNHPEFLRDRGSREFICDSLRMLVIGATTPQEIDLLMDLDIEVQRRSQFEPVAALLAVAEALPGLGIVAAVLGVVITMGAIGGSPETVGEKVAAALVGTFLGILLCYGVASPMASRMEKNGEVQMQLLQVMRTAIAAFSRGAAPLLAVEYARRSIPAEWRPSFEELEAGMRRDARIPPVPGNEPANRQEASVASPAGS